MKTYKMKVNGNEYEVAVEKVSNDTTKVKLNGVEYNIEVDTQYKKVNKPLLNPTPDRAPVAAAPVAAAAPAAGGGGEVIKAPLPGVILDIYVSVGDAVKAGQKVMMLEAMKMENNIEAESDGVVKSIHVSKGANVLEGDKLISIG